MADRRNSWLILDLAVAVGTVVLIGGLWAAAPAGFALLGAVLVLLALPPYISLRTTPPVRLGEGKPESRPFVSAGPPPRAAFRGRNDELEQLRDRYKELRTSDTTNGPIILAVHGMPGVGKSALAVELARTLADDFPDGQLYANLGNAGRIRAEADILYRFLRSLKVPPQEIPTSTVDRSAYFRSATANSRMLVILDAARDQDQVARLMPAGDDCAVIVTSRRDLGGALGVRSLRLRVPDLDDALAILRSVSNTAFGEDQKFAIELVQRVGRLPLAIRAAGDLMVQQMTTLADVTRTLREPAALERILRSYGRGVEDRFDSEYGRLTAVEQRALRLLSLVDTPSFVPWVLIPLLAHDVRDYAEVEKLISRLSERQLLEPAGVDEMTGLDRYSFHPLVRMFAERRRRDADDDANAALSRVDEAYLEAAERVLAGLDPEYRYTMPTQRPPKWYPAQTTLSERIARLPGRWIRSEYANLVRGVHAAYASRQWHLAWRIAARLGDCAPQVSNPGQVRRAFEVGLTAAERDGDPFGPIEVQLARGGWLSRIGDLTGAFQALERAAQLANVARSGFTASPEQPAEDLRAAVGKTYRVECEARRRIAEAHLAIGAFRDAGVEIRRARRLADLADDQRQTVLLRLMHCHVAHDHPDTIPARDHEDEEIRFWRELAAAEHEVRHGNFASAWDRLRWLRHDYEDDTARVGTLLMRMAALRLEELSLGNPQDAQHTAERALHRVAEAVNRFQLVGDTASEINARSIMLRAQVHLNWIKPAQIQLETITARLREADPLVRHERSPLWAAAIRAEGELLRATGDREGRAVLARAAAIFRAHGNHLAEAGIQRAYGFHELPADAFDSGPAGREPAAWPVGGDDLVPGRPFTVAFGIGAPALVDGSFPAGGRMLLILLMADGADADPPSYTLRLDSWAPLGPVRFQLTPRRPGSVLVRFLVYDADRGTLLHESHLPPFDVAELARQDVAV